MSTGGQLQPGVGSARGRYSKTMIVLWLLFLGGAATFAYVVDSGSDSMNWGLFTANFIFLLGVSQFGVCFSAIMRICGAEWSRPFYRLGEVVTLAFLPFAIVVFLLIYAHGREELFYWLDESHHEHLSSWLSAPALFWRNLLAQVVFYIVAVVYFIGGLLPDITEQMAAEGPGWRRALYRWLLARKSGRDMGRVQTRVYFYSPVVLLACGVANTFIAWDFGMMLVPHYHSTVFTLYYIMGIMFAGSAALLLLHLVVARFVAIGDYIGTEQIKNLGIMLTAFALLWVYMFWAQFFVTWFGNLPEETEPLWRQMYGHYGPFFWTMIICIIGIPLGTLIFARIKRTLWTMVLITLIMNLGIWLNRYLIVVPALAEDHVPFRNFVEVALTVGLFAGFFIVLLWLATALPMLTRWDIEAIPAQEGHEY